MLNERNHAQLYLFKVHELLLVRVTPFALGARYKGLQDSGAAMILSREIVTWEEMSS